jgi:sulfatase maturation enzyme AslB (radical SAM superfamily)
MTENELPLNRTGAIPKHAQAKNEEDQFWRQLPDLNGIQYAGLLTKGNVNRPLYLRIETVNACNNLCIICAYRDQERTKRTMDMDVFKKAIQDYVALGGGFLSLTPLVGDILLDRKLTERLRYLETVPSIRELGVTTNAVLASRFDDGDLQYLVERFGRISISVYGLDPDEYEKMTQRRTYKEMVEGIRRILMRSPRQVSLEFRMLKKRSEEDIFRWVAEEVLPDLQPQVVRQKARINSAISDYANWGIYGDENTPLPHDARWFASEYRQQRPQCLIPIFACIVFSNGNVSFCACDNFDDDPELRLGSLVESSLGELYNAPRAARLWNWSRHGTPEFCRNCSFHIPLSTLQSNPSILTNPHQIVGAG